MISLWFMVQHGVGNTSTIIMQYHALSVSSCDTRPNYDSFMSSNSLRRNGTSASESGSASANYYTKIYQVRLLILWFPWLNKQLALLKHPRGWGRDQAVWCVLGSQTVDLYRTSYFPRHSRFTQSQKNKIKIAGRRRLIHVETAKKTWMARKSTTLRSEMRQPGQHLWQHRAKIPWK